MDIFIAAAIGMFGGFMLGLIWAEDAMNLFATDNTPAIDTLDLTKLPPISSYSQQEIDHVVAQLDTTNLGAEYAVTGSPRHIPWSRRKKELEASARQKRRHLESFTEPQ